jgi:hypothetical protein
MLLASGLAGVLRYHRRQRHTCDRLAASNGEPERSPNRLTS